MTETFDDRADTWDDDPERAARAVDVAGQIRQRLPVAEGMDILDFGSGTGLLGFQLLPHVASVTFADPSDGMLRQVRGKLRSAHNERGLTLRLDPAALTLPRSYDGIVSMMALHHVTDPTAVLHLLAEHVEPGGWLAICDLDTEDGTFHEDPDADVHHGFDRDELAALATDRGFTDVEVSTAFVMRIDRPQGPRGYPLFLLTARRGRLG